MNKKKKILFFHFDLQGGGAEKVLVNLLNHLNPEKYDITLQTIFGAGPNVNSLPSHILPKQIEMRPIFLALATEPPRDPHHTELVA